MSVGLITTALLPEQRRDAVGELAATQQAVIVPRSGGRGPVRPKHWRSVDNHTLSVHGPCKEQIQGRRISGDDRPAGPAGERAVGTGSLGHARFETEMTCTARRTGPRQDKDARERREVAFPEGRDISCAIEE